LYYCNGMFPWAVCSSFLIFAAAFCAISLMFRLERSFCFVVYAFPFIFGGWSVPHLLDWSLSSVISISLSGTPPPSLDHGHLVYPRVPLINSRDRCCRFFPGTPFHAAAIHPPSTGVLPCFPLSVLESFYHRSSQQQAL